jgi:hypothetical protein
MSQKGQHRWAERLAQAVIDGTATLDRKDLHRDLEIALSLIPSHAPPDRAI